MPTGTNLTYVSAAGSGHYPIPTARDGYRQAHAPQAPKRTGLDWSALTPTGDTRPVRCRWCRHISDQLDDDQLCPDCLNVATQAIQPPAQPPTPELPMEGKQGQPTTGNSAPGATSTSSTTGRAPVTGPSTHREKNPAAAPETRPTAAAGPRDQLDRLIDDLATIRATLATELARIERALDQLLQPPHTQPAVRPNLAERLIRLGVTTREVRTWARETGLDVPSRGVVPTRVLDAFEEAHHRNSKENQPA